MWTTESFRSLDLLVAYLNDRKLRPGQCKIVAGGEGGGAIYHLLYETSEVEPDLLAQEATVDVELVPVAGTDGDDAVDLAERIIHEAQQEE